MTDSAASPASAVHAETHSLSGVEAERQRDLFELACSTARLGIFERDLRRGTGYWNQTLYEIRGLQGDSAAPPFEDVASGVVDADRAHFDRAMRGSLLPRRDPVRQQHFRMQYRVRAPDDSIRYLHKQWIVRYGPDGQVRISAHRGRHFRLIVDGVSA